MLRKRDFLSIFALLCPVVVYANTVGQQLNGNLILACHDVVEADINFHVIAGVFFEEGVFVVGDGAFNELVLVSLGQRDLIGRTAFHAQHIIGVAEIDFVLFLERIGSR